MKHLILFTSFLSLTLISCLDVEKKEHLSELEKMNFTLDSLHEVYLNIPLDSFSIMRETAVKNEKIIKTYYVDDTIDVEFARAMNRYKAIRKGSGAINQRRFFLDTIFVFQKQQLEKLTNDINNSLGKRDKYASYLEAEKGNITLIHTNLGELSSRFLHLQNEFHELNPIIGKMVERLINENE
jgi:hypothetical protein